MTDAELIAMARLAQRDDRMSTGALYGDLADRIEAQAAEIERLRGDLKRAVEALENIAYGGSYTDMCIARATLAEIKGESHE